MVEQILTPPDEKAQRTEPAFLFEALPLILPGELLVPGFLLGPRCPPPSRNGQETGQERGLLARGLASSHSWVPPHCRILPREVGAENLRTTPALTLENYLRVDRCANGGNIGKGKTERFLRLLSGMPGLSLARSHAALLCKIPIPAHPRTSLECHRERHWPLPLRANSICHLHSFQPRELSRSLIPEEKSVYSTMFQKLKPGPRSCVRRVW